MKQAEARVITNDEVTPGVHLVWLDCSDIAAEARPGQFVMVRCGEDLVLRRPFSIHRWDGDKLALMYAVVGKGTQWLSNIKVGEIMDVFGPLGNGFLVQPGTRKLLLVAGGIGLTPLCFLAQEALKKRLSVTLLYGTANKERYEDIPSGVELVAATEDGSVGSKGIITALLPDFAGQADQIFACGPLPMYKAMAQMSALKPKPVQVSLEVRMGCGFGVCYGCTVKTKDGLKQVCQDGPVFDFDDIIWDELGG
ncbi:dihydroorotate dehydrogenase electron transfer subunit [Chloroflexota bacterium]